MDSDKYLPLTSYPGLIGAWVVLGEILTALDAAGTVKRGEIAVRVQALLEPIVAAETDANSKANQRANVDAAAAMIRGSL